MSGSSSDDGSTATGWVRRRSPARAEVAEPEARRDVGPNSRYRLGARIGEGAMGVVYEAVDSELDRAVALKRVHPRRTDADTRARLLSEARTLARLSHPNIVPVFDVTTEGDEVFVAMELVVGDDLRSWGRREPRSWRAIVDVVAQAGDGLAYAHAQGVVHRDFKPTNVLIGHDGRARVVDFGLARPIPEEASSVGSSDASEDPSPGSGTPRYMAPEVRAGQTASPLADQFGFCVTAWELLFGHRPSSVDDARTHAQGRRVPRRMSEPRCFVVCPRHRRIDSPTWPRSSPGCGDLPRPVGGSPAWALLAVVAGVFAWPKDDPCIDVASAVETTWGPTRLAALQDAFASTGSANAQQAADRVAARLDQHVAGWVAERERSCHATLVQRTQSRGMYELQTACLEDVRDRHRRVARRPDLRSRSCVGAPRGECRRPAARALRTAPTRTAHPQVHSMRMTRLDRCEPT